VTSFSELCRARRLLGEVVFDVIRDRNAVRTKLKSTAGPRGHHQTRAASRRSLRPSRRPYAYAIGNPLNGSDPTGLCDAPMWVLVAPGCLAEIAAPWLRNSPMAGPVRSWAQANIASK
jgi:hypothetical protein